MEEFRRTHEEFMERSTMQHNEIMTLLREERRCYEECEKHCAEIITILNRRETRLVVESTSAITALSLGKNMVAEVMEESIALSIKQTEGSTKEEDKWPDANRLGERPVDTSEYYGRFNFGLPELKEADSKEHKKVVSRRSEEPDHTKLEDFNEQPEKMADEPCMRVQSDYVAAWVGLVSHQQTTATYELQFDTRSDAIFGHPLQLIVVSILLHSSDPQKAVLHIKIWDPGITIGKSSNQHLEDKVFLGAGVMI